MEYSLDNGACIPQRLHTVVVSVQHSEDISLEDMRQQIRENIIEVKLNVFFAQTISSALLQAVVPARFIDDKTIYHIQPSGSFIVGGPQV